jgi:hypothetical protein
MEGSPNDDNGMWATDVTLLKFVGADDAGQACEYVKGAGDQAVKVKRRGPRSK